MHLGGRRRPRPVHSPDIPCKALRTAQHSVRPTPFLPRAVFGRPKRGPVAAKLPVSCASPAPVSVVQPHTMAATREPLAELQQARCQL